MNKENTNYTFDGYGILLFISKKFKYLFIIGIAAFIISAVVSFLITPKFKSNVILFPAPSISVAKKIFSESATPKTMAVYGEEEEVEQVLQVLNSENLKNRIIQKFDLMKHYEIDPNSSYPRTNLMTQYDKNINCSRTEYMSIKIEVLDKNPQLAADIANSISEIMDTIMNEIEKDRAKKIFELSEKSYNKLLSELQNNRDSLNKITKMGVNDYNSQSEVFNEQYAIALSKGNVNVTKLEEKIKILSKYGISYNTLMILISKQVEQLTIVASKCEEARIDAEQFVPHKIVVNKAYKAEKKAYPIRWLIVLSSTLSTLIFAIFIFLAKDIYTEFRRSQTAQKNNDLRTNPE